MASTLLAIADALVTKIDADWNPTAPNAVSRKYLPDIPNPKDFTEGRQVWVVPAVATQADIASRAKDRNVFTLWVLFTAKFPADTQGQPTQSWIDDEVDFVEDVWRLVTEARGTLLPSPLDDVVAGESRMPVLYDDELLRENRLFHTGIEVVYERDEA